MERPFCNEEHIASEGKGTYKWNSLIVLAFYRHEAGFVGLFFVARRASVNTTQERGV